LNHDLAPLFCEIDFQLMIIGVTKINGYATAPVTGFTVCFYTALFKSLKCGIKLVVSGTESEMQISIICHGFMCWF
jgi:hypothetical protein